MRIVYIVTRSDRIGGALIHVRDLSRALQQQGHDVTVLTGGTGCFTDELKEQGTPVIALRYLTRDIHPIMEVRAFLEIRRVLRELQPDIVSAHSAKAGWLGRLAASSLGIPVLATAHGWAFTDGIPRRSAAIYRVAERLASPFADRIITVSDFDRQLAIRQRVVSQARLVTVHNGMPDVDPSLRARADASPPRLVMVARFEPQKDHATLLRALSELQDQPWTLELIGDGPLMEQARAMTVEYGIAARVEFVGARRDVAARLAASQLFLLISNWEGFPRSILEAMRAGLPVVASRVGGAHESVDDRVTGRIIPPRDVAALVSVLRPLLADPELRARMGNAARRRYEEQFTFERMFTQTCAIYRDVIMARAATRARSRVVPPLPTPQPQSLSTFVRGNEARTTELSP